MSEEKENDEICIIFWSKNDDFSKRLKDQLKQEKNIRSICVDNNEVRKRILESTHYEIKEIPCILEIYSNGNDSLIGAKDCLSWYHSFQKKKKQNYTKSSILDERMKLSSSEPSVSTTSTAKTSQQGEIKERVSNPLAEGNEAAKSTLSIKQLSEQLMLERENLNN